MILIVYLIEVLLQETVDPRFRNFHRSDFIGNVATFYQHHLQLNYIRVFSKDCWGNVWINMIFLLYRLLTIYRLHHIYFLISKLIKENPPSFKQWSLKDKCTFEEGNIIFANRKYLTNISFTQMLVTASLIFFSFNLSSKVPFLILHQP